LPEVATTLTAVLILENPSLALHNLLGGVAFQTVILAVADAAMRRRGALTFFTPRFVRLIQGVGLVVLLLLAIAGLTVRGAPAPLATSAWALALLVTYVGMVYLVYRHRGQPRWTPTRADDVPDEAAEGGSDEEPGTDPAPWLWFGAMSLLVLGAGWLATHTAELLAKQTGLGSAFVGATLLAAATSLPELSSTISSVRNGRFTLAISNVFGSNSFDVALIFVAEVAYTKGTIFVGAESSVVFVAALGAIMTCVYLWGLMEREDRTILGIGWDSAIATLVYLGGVSVLYFTSR
jgi:cation:H+ antiporter